MSIAPLGAQEGRQRRIGHSCHPAGGGSEPPRTSFSPSRYSCNSHGLCAPPEDPVSSRVAVSWAASSSGRFFAFSSSYRLSRNSRVYTNGLPFPDAPLASPSEPPFAAAEREGERMLEKERADPASPPLVPFGERAFSRSCEGENEPSEGAAGGSTGAGPLEWEEVPLAVGLEAAASLNELELLVRRDGLVGAAKEKAEPGPPN